MLWYDGGGVSIGGERKGEAVKTTPRLCSETETEERERGGEERGRGERDRKYNYRSLF